jgi:hypothetical protein
MLVVDGPPPTQQLTINTGIVFVLATEGPGFVFSNEVNDSDTALEMSIGRNILVVSTGGAVVDET